MVLWDRMELSTVQVMVGDRDPPQLHANPDTDSLLYANHVQIFENTFGKFGKLFVNIQYQGQYWL